MAAYSACLPCALWLPLDRLMTERNGGLMEDLISRKAAIDVIRKWKRYETTEGLVDRINNLPSAQPTISILENVEDTISRQAAINAIIAKLDAIDHVPQWVFDELTGAIGDLPSAQPDLPIKEKCAFCPHCNNCDVNDDLSIQPCMDTISRQAAIEAFLTELTKRERKNLLHTWSTVEVKYFITKMLEQMPSAQPE